MSGKGVQDARNCCSTSAVEVFTKNEICKLPKLGEKPETEQLQKLLPWSDALPEYCKVSKRA